MSDFRLTNTCTPAPVADVATLARELHLGETVFELRDALRGDHGQRLEVSVKRPEPLDLERADSPPREHTFYSVDSLIAYLREFTEPQCIVSNDTDQTVLEDGSVTECDIDSIEMALAELRGGAIGVGVAVFVAPGHIVAVLDERAEVGREAVSCVPQTNPLWEPWKNAVGRRLSAAEFLDLIRTGRREIRNPQLGNEPEHDAQHDLYARQLVRDLRQVKASKQIEVFEGTGSDALNGIVMRTKVERGKGDQAERVDIPDSLHLFVPIFLDEPSIHLELDLVVDVDDQHRPTFQLSSADITRAELIALAKGKQRIADALPGAVVTWGTRSEGSWVYLDAPGAPRLSTRPGVGQ